LDPKTFARIQQAAIARESWTTQGNPALADYYWGALNAYADGRVADPASTLRDVTLEDANAALKALLKEPGYVRIEAPLLGDDGLYGVLALLVVLALALVWLRRRRRRRQRAPQARPSGATRRR
ncbi:MAG: peptidase, partial [Pseudomonas sp.]|nr:peptidase [Pseudomonas sp.]